MVNFYNSFFSRSIQKTSATACSLNIYFLPPLPQNQTDNDNIGREFRRQLVAFSENGIQKLALQNKYVLEKNGLPAISATVGKSPFKESYCHVNNQI